MDDEQLAVIKNVGIGMRDCNSPVLWFDTFISPSRCALQVIPWAEAEQIIEDAEVYDVKKLEGKTCYVKDDDGFLKFIRMSGI